MIKIGDKLLEAAEELERDRNIPQEEFISYVCDAIVAAYKKKVPDHDVEGVRAIFDTETGEIGIFAPKEGVDKVSNEYHEISLGDAQDLIPDVTVGEVLEIEVTPQDFSEFGRIAAQTAKQVVIQRIREAERSSIIDEFGTKEGEVISGVVQKIDRGTVYIDFHRTVGMISPEEQIPGEEYRRGERVRAYLYSVEETPRGVMLRLSRTHPKFIETLFAFESPEISSGVVVIKSIAREPGSRSKIAVYSTDEHIDPVGSCVGGRGVRVSAVMSELAGEKIDIIPWSENPTEFVANSLSPAEVINIVVDEKEHKASVEVNADQLSLAIGKGGQNVRLAAKLTGWRIDIKGVKGDEFVASSDGETVETKDVGEESPSIIAPDIETPTEEKPETANEETPADETPSEKSK